MKTLIVVLLYLISALYCSTAQRTHPAEYSFITNLVWYHGWGRITQRSYAQAIIHHTLSNFNERITTNKNGYVRTNLSFIGVNDNTVEYYVTNSSGLVILKYRNEVETNVYRGGFTCYEIAKLIRVESGFNSNVISKVVKSNPDFDCIGPMQVSYYHWGSVYVWRIPDNNVQLFLKKNPENARLVMQDTWWNVWMGCQVLRYYMVKYNGCKELALVAYWAGPSSPEFKALGGNPLRAYQYGYVEYILKGESR